MAGSYASGVFSREPSAFEVFAMLHITESGPKYRHSIPVAAHIVQRRYPHLLKFCLPMGTAVAATAPVSFAQPSAVPPPPPTIAVAATAVASSAGLPPASALAHNAITSLGASRYVFVLTGDMGERAYGFCRRGLWGEIYCIVTKFYWPHFFDRAIEYFVQAGEDVAFMRALQAATLPRPGSLFLLSMPAALLAGVSQVPSSLGPRRGSFRGQPPPDWPVCTRPPKDAADEANIAQLLIHLTYADLLSALGALLTEQRVVVLGFTTEIVSQCVMALHSLLQPFEWPHALVPVVPKMFIELFSSPTPFLMGMTYQQAAALNMRGALGMLGAVVVNLGLCLSQEDASSLSAALRPPWCGSDQSAASEVASVAASTATATTSTSTAAAAMDASPLPPFRATTFLDSCDVLGVALTAWRLMPNLLCPDAEVDPSPTATGRSRPPSTWGDNSLMWQYPIKHLPVSLKTGRRLFSPSCLDPSSPPPVPREQLDEVAPQPPLTMPYSLRLGVVVPLLVVQTAVRAAVSEGGGAMHPRKEATSSSAQVLLGTCNITMRETILELFANVFGEAIVESAEEAMSSRGHRVSVDGTGGSQPTSADESRSSSPCDLAASVCTTAARAGSFSPPRNHGVLTEKVKAAYRERLTMRGTMQAWELSFIHLAMDSIMFTQTRAALLELMEAREHAAKAEERRRPGLLASHQDGRSYVVLSGAPPPSATAGQHGPSPVSMHDIADGCQTSPADKLCDLLFLQFPEKFPAQSRRRTAARGDATLSLNKDQHIAPSTTSSATPRVLLPHLRPAAGGVTKLQSVWWLTRAWCGC